MDKIIFKSEYAIATFNESTKIFICTYLSETEYMLNSEWKELMLEILALHKEYAPQYIIDNNRDRLYAYEPEIQAWTLEQFVGCWNRIHLKKYVQIIPQNIIGQIATEQIFELAIKDFSPQFEIKYIESMNDAMDWIKE